MILSRRDNRKLASHIVAGNRATNALRPERTLENLRTIPSSFQDEFIFSDDTSHFVAG
jgi:hypothetical protein